MPHARKCLSKNELWLLRYLQPFLFRCLRNKIMGTSTRCYLAQVKCMLPGEHALTNRSQMFILGWGWSFTSRLRCRKTPRRDGQTNHWSDPAENQPRKKGRSVSVLPYLLSEPAGGGGTWARASVSEGRSKKTRPLTVAWKTRLLQWRQLGLAPA